MQGWGLKTRRRAAILPWEREYARIKIDGLVGGNPDFTNAPAHADDDARFHDRQQAYVHARGDSSDPPKTRIDYSWVQEERERWGGRVVINLT